MMADPSANDALSHPLFSTSLASTQGEFRNAFSGIAALIDEEEEEEQDKDDSAALKMLEKRRSNSDPLQLLAFVNNHKNNTTSTAKTSTGQSFTWTRPSAIRIAKLKAEAQERAARGEETRTRASNRAVPYERRSAARRVTSNDGEASMTDVVDSGRGFGAIRSHAARRKKGSRNNKTSNADIPSFPPSSSSILQRMSIRGDGESSAVESSSDEEENQDNRAPRDRKTNLTSAPLPGPAPIVQTGETTMLMAMWKM